LKHKLALLIIITLFLLSVACGNGGGDTTTTVDESCWQRVYNECIDADNGVWICNDFAEDTCSAE
jgi:hypothetical protein